MENNTKMITREQYMENSKELFHAYYSQFVTQSTLNFVERQFGVKRLRASTDEHLNDLCKHTQGGAGNWTWDFSPINTSLLKPLGENNSDSTHTCVGKAAARMILERRD